jgi:hypothetical protein
MGKSSRLPSYDQLGKDGASPPGSSWSVYGRDDQLGSVGLLTPEAVLEGASLVKKGAVFSLNWALELPSPALFTRQLITHTISFSDDGADDAYDSFYPQCSSQWDGLSHIRHPEYGFYQGHQKSAITGRPGTKLGVEHWARRGIVGRFVLADIERYRRATGRPVRADQFDETTVEDIEKCLELQGTQLNMGDVLLLRFGWISWYEGASQTKRELIGGKDNFPACGLSSSEESARWIWNRGLAAIAGDNPALEAQPFDPSKVDGFLHYRLIPLLGMAIGEMFALDELASDCADDNRYEGMFVSAPLNKLGGVGSTANALALK